MPTTNTVAATIDSIIQNAIFTLGVNAAYADAVAATNGILGLPIISSLFKLALNWFAGLIYKYVAQLATFTVINFQTQAELDTYNSASSAIAVAVASGDANAIATAKQNFINALAGLVNFDGSATISARDRFKARFTTRLTIKKPLHTIQLYSDGRVFRMRNFP